MPEKLNPPVLAAKLSFLNNHYISASRTIATSVYVVIIKDLLLELI